MPEVELHSLPLAVAYGVQLYRDFGLTPKDVGAYRPIGLSGLGFPYKNLVGAEH